VRDFPNDVTPQAVRKADALTIPAIFKKSRRDWYRASGVISEEGTSTCFSLRSKANSSYLNTTTLTYLIPVYLHRVKGMLI
jgi:hypothetical protein